MKTNLFALILVITASFTCANSKKESIVGMLSKFDQFDKSTMIQLHNGGGMHSSSQDVYISFDNCICIEILQETKNNYRIRIGDYRLGLIINGNKVELIRLLHRKEIDRFFP
jgi:hypothetical protein